MTSPDSPLVERDAELSTFHGLLDGLSRGRTAALLVDGAPGTGRSALVAEFARCARKAGHIVLGARCRHTDLATPFAVPRQVFAAGPDTPSAAGPDPGAVSSLWRGLGVASPVVLVDDVHWADPDSLRWLRAMAAPDGGPGLLVVAGTAALAPDGEPALPAGRAHRLDLGSLSVEAIAALLGGPGAALETASGPGPAAEIVEAAQLVAAGHGTLDECRAMVAGERTRRLLPVAPAALSAVLRAVSAGDGKLGLPLVATLAGCDAEVLPALLNRLRSIGLVTGPAARPRVPAAHEVLAEIAETDRDALITRAAVLGGRAGLPAEDVAMLLLRAGPVRQPWVRELLRAGARSALAGGAVGTATAVLRRLLREAPSPGERAEALLELGGAELPADTEAAGRHLGQVLRGVPGDDQGGHRVRAADLLLARGDGLAVRRGIAASFDDPVLSEEDRAALLGLHWLAEDDLSGDPGLGMGTAVLPAVPERPATPALAAVAALRLALRGARPARVRGLARDVLTAAVTDIPVTAGATAVFALQLTDDLEEAAEHVARLVKAAGRPGKTVLVARLSLARAELSMAARSWERSLAELAALREELTPGCWHPALQSRLLAMEAVTRVQLGDVERARAAVELAPPRARGASGAVWLAFAHGLVLSAEARYREAVTKFRECGRQLSSRGWENPEFLPWRWAAAHCLSELGEGEAAAGLLAEEIALADGWGTPSAAGKARLRAALVRGVTGAGRAHLRRAVELLTRATPRAPYGRALLGMAEAHLAAGEAVSARDAVALADALATRHDWRELTPLMSSIGGRAEGSAPAGGVSGDLSRSQLRVAELAARGVSNAGIAARLAVRKRTVELHLTQVYRKLGIGGRDQLAEALRTVGADR